MEEALEQELTCEVCLDLYHQPLLLPCAHSFCQACLHGCLHQQSKFLECPRCRYTVKLPKGVDELPPNTTLASIVSSFQRHRSLPVPSPCPKKSHPSTPLPPALSRDLQARLNIGLERMKWLQNLICDQQAELLNFIQLVQSFGETFEDANRPHRGTRSLTKAAGGKVGDPGQLTLLAETLSEALQSIYDLMSEATLLGGDMQRLHQQTAKPKTCVPVSAVSDILARLDELCDRFRSLEQNLPAPLPQPGTQTSSSCGSDVGNSLSSTSVCSPLSSTSVCTSLSFTSNLASADTDPCLALSGRAASPTGRPPLGLNSRLAADLQPRICKVVFQQRNDGLSAIVHWRAVPGGHCYKLVARRQSRKTYREWTLGDVHTEQGALTSLPFDTELMVHVQTVSQEGTIQMQGPPHVVTTPPAIKLEHLEFDPMDVNQTMRVSLSRQEMFSATNQHRQVDGSAWEACRLVKLPGAVAVQALVSRHYWECKVTVSQLSALAADDIVCEVGICLENEEDKVKYLSRNWKALCVTLVAQDGKLMTEFRHGRKLTMQIAQCSMQLGPGSKGHMVLGFFLDTSKKVFAIIHPASSRVLGKCTLPRTSRGIPFLPVAALYCEAKVMTTLTYLQPLTLPSVVYEVT